MAESQDIIITFKADTTGLTPAVDVIEKLGKITNADAEAFKKANTATQEFNKTTQQTQQILDGNGKALKVSTDNVKKFGEEATKATEKVKGLATESGKSTGKFGGLLKDITGNFGSLKDALSGIGAGIAAAFAVEKVLAFGKESLKAFQEAELNAQKLQVAVGVNGGVASDFEKLVNQSEQLQKITIFSDDDIQRAQTMALQFGLTTDQVEKLIPVITDYASATGDTLQGALSNVIGGLEGNARALKKQGISLLDNVDSTTQLANITDQLNLKFKDQAQIIGETSAGAAAKLANQFDDIKESIGSVISGFTDASATILSFVLNGLEPLDDGLDTTTSKLKLTTKELEAFGKGVNAAEIGLLQLSIDRLNQSGGDVSKLTAQLQKLKDTQVRIDVVGLSNDEVQKRIKNLEDIKFKTKEISDELRILQEESKKRNLDLIVSEKDLSTFTVIELRRRQDLIRIAARETNSKTLNDALEAITNEINAREKVQNEATKKAFDAKVRAGLELAKLEADIAKRAELDLAKTEQERLAIVLKYALLELEIRNKAAGKTDTDKAYITAKQQLYDEYDRKVLAADNKQKEEKQKNRDKDIEADSKAQEAMVKNLEETNDETNKLNEEQRQLQLDLEEQFRQDKKALINQIEDEALQASFGLFQANIDAQLALLEEQTTQEQEVYDERIRLNQEQFDKRIITAKQFRAEEDKLNKEKVAAEKVAQTQINELRRKADIADRAEKVFQIAIATARNIAEQPGPVGALIPFWVGVGAFQIAAVLAQPLPKYAKGTLSLQGNNDEVPIIAHRGEAITPTKQSKEYNATLRAIHERSIPAEALNNFVKGFNYKPSYVASTTTANSFSIDYDKLAKSIAWQMRGSGNVNIKNVKQIADALKQDNDVRRYRG